MERGFQLEQTTQCWNVIGSPIVIWAAPGVSRSGTVIRRSLSLGIDRKTLAQSSFFLAVPTMYRAAAYALYKRPAAFTEGSVASIAVGLVVSFVVDIVVVPWRVSCVSRRSVSVFAWHRIVAGVGVLPVLYAA